jgi:hypothetical protein
MSDLMRVSADTHSGYAVMQLTGELSLQSVETVRGALVGLLNDVGCVVADLSGLGLSQPTSLLVFPAALAEAGGWPRARLGLFGADAEVLGHLQSQGVCDAVAVADELDSVLMATTRRPHRTWAPPHQAEGEAIDERTIMCRVLTGAQSATEVALFVREQLGRLLDYDRGGGFELVPTLWVYLDCAGDLDMAARRLCIHRSTLRYRLQRIQEISGHDLGEANTRFNLHVATSQWGAIHGPS